MCDHFAGVTSVNDDSNGGKEIGEMVTFLMGREAGMLVGVIK